MSNKKHSQNKIDDSKNSSKSNNKTQKEIEALNFHIQGQPGKVAMHATKPLNTQRELALAYSPGVAVPCLEIQKNPDSAYDYTAKGNYVAVISNGTAVLGLGNLGALAGKPVMEGKSVLFKRFADIDSVDIEVDTENVDEFINAVKYLGPSWGGINLEDIKAPECFIIESKLREIMDIPVFHDDQHGTAIVVLAALKNALKLVKKELSKVKIVISGAGAAGTAIAKLLTVSGAKNILAFHREGIAEIMGIDNHGFKGDLRQALQGADVFIGVSAGNILSESDLKAMAENSIVFALANPDPEIDPVIARKFAAVVATGRSDQPNQINNVLAFPGIFRGLLDANAHKITDKLLVAAAEAIAECVAPSQLNANFIIPSVFDQTVAKQVATAVKNAAK